MATGSKRYFEYTADDGQTYGMNLDESTYENPALAFGQALGTGDPEYAGLLSASGTRPLAPRYFNMVGTNSEGETVRRRVFVGSNDTGAWVNPQAFTINLLTVVGNTATSTPFVVSSAIGERRTFVPAQDTGQTDGDVDENIEAGPAPA